MKRRFLCIIMVMVLLFSSLAVMDVSALTSGAYEYEMYSDNTVMITKYTGGEKQKLVIPSEIDGYKVVAIYNQAFENLQAEEIILPDTLEYIGTLAFLNTYAKTIHIPESVISLGAASFCGADFTTFTVDKDSETLKAIDGVLYSKDGAVLVSYPCGKSETQFTVPEGVEYIYNGAFFCSYNLEKVIMPEGLLGIYPDAFIACTGITSVDIPATVEYVGEYAFSQCTSLKEINVLGGDIEYISSTAFEETHWLDKHPSGVVYLGTMAYAYNRRAQVGEVANIKEGTTMICEKAFASTESPYTINIPASVEYIDISAFLEPYHLENINVHGDNKYFCSVDGVLYSKDMKILYAHPTCAKRTVMDIPEGVEVIYENALRKSTKLKEIICPESLIAIGDNAFRSCYGLERIEFKGDVEYVGLDILEGSRNVEEVVLPEGAVGFSWEDFQDTFWYISKYKEFVCPNGTLIGYADGFNGLSLTIPEEAISVGRLAFANNNKIVSVILPKTLKRIGPCAFENCPKLKSITIPASVDEIYPFALGYTYVEGETKYDGEHFPVEGFTIKGYSNSVAEAYAIENGFEFVAIGEIEVSKLLGDADLDEIITIKDATAIQKYLASLQLFVTQQKINVDMNGDGSVDIKDATAIQKYLAGLE